ncbi:hypothetical protein [Pseudomonas fragi]|uniref:Uncharacterized protein n=1 Tax=Pseudomonas fragi TaxID=296 RepID=A0A449IEZ2_PSEFR|nr:hypothetical protein [Pseudomonas fragi]VFB17946.1 Uncharacterised protein [Pseudomonas fragi]
MSAPLTAVQIIKSTHDGINSASTVFELDSAMNVGDGCLNTLRQLELIDNGQWIRETNDLCSRTERRRTELLRG